MYSVFNSHIPVFSGSFEECWAWIDERKPLWKYDVRPTNGYVWREYDVV